MTILIGAVLRKKREQRKLLLTAIAGPDGVHVAEVVLTGADWFRDLRARSAARQILLPDRLLDPINLVLVAFTVAHRTLLSIAQRRLQGLDALHRCAQSFLQFRQFATEVSVVPDELFVHL